MSFLTLILSSGENGRGVLRRCVGIGEYLDKQSIEKAYARATNMGRTIDLLPVVKLSLTGFVVDSDPFFLWFNPHRLRVLNFKNDCVDAGFTLPAKMAEHVVVNWPNRVSNNVCVSMPVTAGKAKLIDLGKKEKPILDEEDENTVQDKIHGNFF